MVNYILLCKDETSQISYFFNMDDEAVYSDQKKADNHVYKKTAKYGAIIALFMYPIIRSAEAWCVEVPGVLCIQITILGLLIGWAVTLFMIKLSEAYFIPENKMDMSKAEIRNLYIMGKGFRKKYNGVFIGLCVFSIISMYALSYFAMNTYRFWCCVLLWSIVGILLWGRRPLCMYRFKKKLRTTNVL